MYTNFKSIFLWRSFLRSLRVQVSKRAQRFRSKLSNNYHRTMIVTVKQGKLQGTVLENVLGSTYIAFKGIPFAAPPLGELRFKDPEPPASWTGVRDASSNGGDVCFQIDILTEQMVGSEDCLYLNVYVPTSIKGTTKNPVMVWIHGGGFIYGTGNDIVYRPDYLLAKEVIVVAINYRLGAFGFLNLGHETASGNQGLKDQIAGLKWVKENIEVFGGDPENITIFGLSAGSVSSHLLTITPQAKGLFQRAILQSGVGTCSWAFVEKNPEANSFKLASLLGNDSTDPEKVVTFLRQIPAEKLLVEQYNILTPVQARVSNVPFAPTIDKKAKNPLFPRPLEEMLDDDNDIPIILGYTAFEYLMFLKDTTEKGLQIMYGDIPLYVKKITNSTDETKISLLSDRVKKWYFNDRPCTDNKESIRAIVQFLSDLYFELPIKELANRRRKRRQAQTYLYKFSYVGTQITTTALMGKETHLIGTSHSDDIAYVFYKTKYKANDPKPPMEGTKDRKIIETFTTMWTNFAKNGIPTPPNQISWLPATPEDFNCLEINDSLQNIKFTEFNNIYR